MDQSYFADIPPRKGPRYSLNNVEFTNPTSKIILTIAIIIAVFIIVIFFLWLITKTDDNQDNQDNSENSDEKC